MTPQEKAKELLDKMNTREITTDEWDRASDYAKDDLKRKVYIVVDEVLDARLFAGQNLVGRNGIENIDTEEFWLEVKQEIEKL